MSFVRQACRLSLRSSSSLSIAHRHQRHISLKSMTELFKPTWPAGLYANARPSYPRSVIDAILKAAPSSNDRQKGLTYVDLAAGTGIFTRLLIEACTKDEGNVRTLSDIVAVEPAENMREELKANLFDEGGLVPTLKKQGKLDEHVRTNALYGVFNSIDLNSLGLQGKVDLLTIAQAWHWCIDWNGALEEIAKTLKPGGVLALVWNLEDRDAARWVAKVRDAYEQFEGNSRQYRHMTWREMYDTEAIKKFDILEEKHITRVLPTTLEGVCDRTVSKSYISMKPQEDQEQVKRDIRQIFATQSDEQLQRSWIDKEAGTFEYPYRTDVFLFRKK